MTTPAVVRRLFAELERGENAELGEIFAALGVLEEPPDVLDAEILGAAAPEAPSPHVDAAIFQAADAALRERKVASISSRRRRPATWVAAAVAVAAGLALAFGLGRASRRPSGAVSDEIAAAQMDLAVRVCAPGRDWRGWPSEDNPSWAITPTAADTDTAASDPDRYAQALIDFTARVRAKSGDRLARELEETLYSARKRCPPKSRCFGALSLRAAELALEDHRPEDAVAAANDAAQSSDPEIAARARALRAQATHP